MKAVKRGGVGRVGRVDGGCRFIMRQRRWWPRQWRRRWQKTKGGVYENAVFRLVNDSAILQVTTVCTT